MKALLRDSFDNTACCYEIKEAVVTDTVYLETDTDEYEPIEFPAVLNITTSLNNDIYVVLPDVTEAETLVTRFFDTGNVDLTSYCETTFINPDYRDIPKLENLLKAVAI